MSKHAWVGLMGLAGLAAALASAPSSDVQAAPGFTVRAVATGGEAAPDFLPGFTLAPSSEDVVGIDPAGRVLFKTSVLNASGQFHADAVYQETNQGLRAVLVTDEPAPTFGVGGSPGTIVNITGIKTDPSGNSLFFCDLDASNGGALISDVDSQLTVVAAEVNTVPGVCGLTDLKAAAFPRKTAFQGGRAVFLAESGPSPTCDPAERQGMYRRVGAGDVSTLLRFGDTIQVANDPGVDKFLEEGFTLASVDQDGNAVFRASYLDSAGKQVIVYAPAGGGRQAIAAEDDSVPGRPGFVWDSFEQVLIDAGSLTQDSVPRIAYVGIEKGTQVTNVMEWNEGITTEAMSTSTTRRGVEFQGGFGTRLLSASRRRLVVIGDVIVTSVGVAEGVWRYDPVKSGDAQIELVVYTGEATPGIPGFTFHSMRSVFCDSDGRIAIIAAITNGSTFEDAIFMEDGGQLKLAVRQGDSIEDGRGGSVTLAQIAAIGDRGSGGAGRGVRFNDRGELVFSAVTDRPPFFGGVFVVSIGDTPPPPPPGPPGAAEVRVRQTRNGTVKMTGSKGDDRVSIRQTTPTEIELVPGPDTILNGAAAPLTLTGVTGLVVKLGDGNDQVCIGSNETVRTVFPRNAVLKMGHGDDRVKCENVEFGGSVTVDTGRGGSEAVRFTLADVERALRVISRSAGLDVDVDLSTILGPTTIKARTTDSCTLDSTGSSFQGVRYSGSPLGDHSITCDQFDAAKRVTIKAGGGDLYVDLRVPGFDDAFDDTLDRTTITSNADKTTVALRLPTGRTHLKGRSRWDVYVQRALDSLNTPPGPGTAYRFSTRGTGACSYEFEDVHYSRLQVTQTGGDCQWDVSNCAGEVIDLKLKGAGTADGSIENVKTNRLNVTTTRGGDTLEMTNSQVSEAAVCRLGPGPDVISLYLCSVAIFKYLGGPDVDRLEKTVETDVGEEVLDGVEESQLVVVPAKH